jgi:hypothetical protein
MKINKSNYLAHFNELPEHLVTEKMKEAHIMLSKITAVFTNWSKVNASNVFSSLADNQFKLIEAIAEKSKDKSKAKAENVKKSKASTPGEKHKTNTKTEEPKVQAHKPAKMLQRSTGKPAEMVDQHIIMLLRFYKFHGKEIMREKLVTFARALVRKTENRVLRKSSKYAPLIGEMQDVVFKLLEKQKSKIIRVSIPNELLRSIEKSGTDEHKMVSVSLLSRYAGLAGRITTLDNVKRLYNAVQRALQNGSIPNNDRYFDRIEDVFEQLSEYINNEDETAELPLLAAELSGITGCSCSSDARELGSLGDWVKLVKQEGGGKPVNSMQFVNSQFTNYPIEGDWLKVFGRPIPGKHTIVYSGAKNAKTTTLLSFAGYLARNFGPVLFVSKEEGVSGTLHEKFAITNAQHPNLTLIDELPETEELFNYRFVFLDSSSKLKLAPEQLAELQKELAPFVCIYAILHATKDGQHRGSNEYKHDADQVVNFPEFGVAKGEGRFSGCTGEPVRFAPERD